MKEVYKRTSEIGLAVVLGLGLTACSDKTSPDYNIENSEDTDSLSARSYMVESHGVDLNVLAQGNPEAKSVTVAIHGGPGLSLESLDDLTDLAGDSRLLIRYDQRGSGESSTPTDGDFSFDSQIQDIQAIVESTGAEKVDLIGRSWGGLLATAYAASHPEQVDDLALISAIPLDIDEFIAGQGRFSARISELQDQGIVPEVIPEAKDNSCAERINAVLPAYMSNPMELEGANITSCTASTSQQAYDAILSPNVLRPYEQQAQRYKGDVLVLAGDKDPFGIEWPRSIQAILGQSALEVVIFENTGHFVTLERPEDSLRLIDKFLQ